MKAILNGAQARLRPVLDDGAGWPAWVFGAHGQLTSARVAEVHARSLPWYRGIISSTLLTFARSLPALYRPGSQKWRRPHVEAEAICGGNAIVMKVLRHNSLPLGLHRAKR